MIKFLTFCFLLVSVLAPGRTLPGDLFRETTLFMRMSADTLASADSLTAGKMALNSQADTCLTADSLALSPADSFRLAVIRPVPDTSVMAFANLDRNRIIFHGDSVSFEKVYSKLDSLRSGDSCNLRIMYIGGSHVQAGTLTGRLRNNLLSIGDSLDGGRGLVFPYWAAKTNTPMSFKTRCEGEWTASRNTQKAPAKRLGLTGMAISTCDSSAFVRVVMQQRKPFEGERNFSFDKVRILGYSSGGNRRPAIVLDCGDTLDFCSGCDSLMAEAAGADSCIFMHPADSCFSFNLPSLQDSLTITVAGDSGEFTLTGIFLDNKRPGITLSEIGVNGAALASYARCADLERDLKMVNPDLVIFGIGINDASGPNFTEDGFVLRYHSLVRKVLSANPDCALLFVTNNDSFKRTRRRGYYVNPNGTLAESAFLRLGKNYGAGVWNMFDIMGGLKSMQKWEASGLAKRDKIHFTDEGYLLLGDLLFNALMDKYSEHLKRL